MIFEIITSQKYFQYSNITLIVVLNLNIYFINILLIKNYEPFLTKLLEFIIKR